MKIDDEEFMQEEIASKLIYFLDLRMAGIIIVAISGLIRIFLR